MNVDIDLHPGRHMATLRGVNIALTAREYVLLAMLLAQPGRIVPRATLEQQLYGASAPAAGRRIEVHLHNLRRKLGGRLIENVRNQGYRLRVADEV